MVKLGEYLKSLRTLKKYTLRQVERKAQISNAYLSQIETGKIERPSIDKLFKLAELYGVPYEVLMEKAGWIPERPISYQCPPNVILDIPLSDEEMKKVKEYIEFLKSKKQN